MVCPGAIGIDGQVEIDCNAARAITMPAPESRSLPTSSISSAVLVSAVRICAVVRSGLNDSKSAAIAAACGAAADVPKNELNPGTEVSTPSAAVMSGLARTAPPVELKLPGVMAVPFALKKTRRGPSELKVSTGLVEPPLNGFGNEVRALTAATLNAFTAAECPFVRPAV